MLTYSRRLLYLTLIWDWASGPAWMQTSAIPLLVSFCSPWS